MGRSFEGTERGATPVVGIILLVGVAVVVAATVTVLALGLAETGSTEAPTISVSYELVDDGSEQAIAVTHESGDTVNAENLYVLGSKNVDIGPHPDEPDGANEQWASEREQFTEGNDQVDVGDEWESGETVYIDPVGSVDGVTIRFAWSKQPVQGQNPGEPRGEGSFVVVEFTVGQR